MATRTDLRGFPKQSQIISEMADSRLPSDISARTKRLSRSRKERVNERLKHSDEFVKYMSKLPDYLERGEEGFAQSNVLNVGVLDWGRLEKWKRGRARDGDRLGESERNVSTTALGTLLNESHRCEIDEQVHTCSSLGKGKSSRDLQDSVHGKARCTLEPELASKVATCSYKSSGRDDEGVNPEKSRRSRSYREPASVLLSDMGNSGGSLKMKMTQKLAGEIDAEETRERATERGKQCVEKLDEEEKIIGDSKAGVAPEKQVFSNIVLLRSRKQSRSTLSGDLQVSLDENTRVAKEINRSLDFSDEINSSFGVKSQIPRSCPLSLDLERDSEDMMLPLGVNPSGKKERFGRKRHSKTASRIFDQEIHEDESRKNRSKRFSFSFGRLSRGFTFKEDTSAQPLSSSDDTIKTDSMRFDSVYPSQSSNLEKQNIHSGSRVSPVKRRLDPLLKSKGSENVLPSKARSSSSNPKPTNMDLPRQDENTLRTRALFQLTIRNGILLFQFVVNDKNKSSKSILGATMENSASSFKYDSVQYCTFYSVNDVKKKKRGSWLIHGHKEKEHEFVYNVIGQMRMSNSDLTEKESGNNSLMVRESVLFDESEQLKERKEVAAAVIKKNCNGLEETTVIIPGGVHSFPEKGAPSSLISRWRTGGLCDCGGWDIGCKLHVISNKTLREFNRSFKLFDQQGSEQEIGPSLTMTELKSGIYRVEFCSFLSHLQAFFVCVTVLTCASGEESVVLKTTGKSSSPFAPPLSPVGRV